MAPLLLLYSPSKSILLPQNKLTGRIFSSLLYSSHTLAWAYMLYLKLSGYACFLYISVTSWKILIQLVLLFTLCILYKYNNIQSYPIAQSCYLFLLKTSPLHIGFIFYFLSWQCIRVLFSSQFKYHNAVIVRFTTTSLSIKQHSWKIFSYLIIKKYVPSYQLFLTNVLLWT